MVKKIEIEIRGTKFETELLEDKAPRTCKAILSILPIKVEGYHYFWSGEGIQTHDPVLRKMGEDAGLWPDVRYPDSRENAKFNGVPGEVGFYPVGGSINITYGQARFYGPPRGVESNYIFGKINNIEKLAEIGKTFKKEGGQTIRIKRI
jgi:hypothetical protein